MNKMIFIAALAAASSAFSPVQGQSGDTRTARIAVASLDLGTQAGVKALDRRILHAASELCGAPSAADPHGGRAYRRCVEEAVRGAAPARQRAIALAREPELVAAASR